jgi:predicted nucleic acid-binding protein
MRRVFADTFYWIALANPKDQWHARVVQTMRSLGQVSLVTSDEVLNEFLTYYSGHGTALRISAVQTVEDALSDSQVTVRPQTRQSFLDGLALYKARPDKGYSLTDCISMQVMRQEGIAEILTHDNHFTQEGFAILI